MSSNIEDQISLGDQIKSVAREIAIRKNLYPYFVRSKKLSQATADHEQAAMRAVLKTLQELGRGTGLQNEMLDRAANDHLRSIQGE